MPITSIKPMSGFEGRALRNGVALIDMLTLDTNTQFGRVTFPVVGSRKQGQKRGLETREGTMSIQKQDSAWERFVWECSHIDDTTLRKLRNAGTPFDASFTLIVKIDDPAALGMEQWQLEGVELWNLPLGFDYGAEVIQREYQVTWQDERPINTFFKNLKVQPPRGEPFPGAGELVISKHLGDEDIFPFLT